MRTQLLAFFAIWIVTSELICADVRIKMINTYAGPFIAYANRFSVCPSDGTMIMDLRVSHFNPAKPFDMQTLSGNFTFSQALDDSFSSYCDLAVRSANQWKQNAFVFNFPVMGCSAMRKHIPDFFRIIAKYTGASMDRNVPCVIPRSHSVFHDEPLNMTFPSVPIMPYGRYKFTAMKRRPGARMQSLCVEVDSQVIPKP